MQDEQRAQPRIEKPAPSDPRTGLLKVILAITILVALALLGLMVL